MDATCVRTSASKMSSDSMALFPLFVTFFFFNIDSLPSVCWMDFPVLFFFGDEGNRVRLQ